MAKGHYGNFLGIVFWMKIQKGLSRVEGRFSSKNKQTKNKQNFSRQMLKFEKLDYAPCGMHFLS